MARELPQDEADRFIATTPAHTPEETRLKEEVGRRVAASDATFREDRNLQLKLEKLEPNP